MRPLALAALAVLLAAPSRAQVARAEAADPNARPKLYEIAPRAPRDAKTPLTFKEGRQLASDLIHGDLNISLLDLYLNRTDIKTNMTPEDRAWAEAEFAKALAQGDELMAAGEAALAAGIEREVPNPNFHIRLPRTSMYLGRAKLGYSRAPTAAELRRHETGALCGVLNGLANIVDSAAQPKEDVKPEELAKVEKALAEDKAELAELRKKLGGTATSKRAAELDKEIEINAKMSSLRAKKAIEDAMISGPAKGAPSAKGAAAAARGVSAEQAAKEANALPAAQPLQGMRKKPAEVPAP